MSDDSFESLVGFYVRTISMLLNDLGFERHVIRDMQIAVSLGQTDRVAATLSEDGESGSVANQNRLVLSRLLGRLVRVVPQLERETVETAALDESADVAWHLGEFTENEATVRTAYNFYEIAWHFRSIMDAPALEIAGKMRALSDPENVDQYHGAIWRLAIERVRQSCMVNGEWLEALDAYELALACPMESPIGQRGMCKMLERRLREVQGTPISDLIAIYFIQAPVYAIDPRKRREVILSLCGKDSGVYASEELHPTLEIIAMVQGQTIFDDMRQRFQPVESHAPYIEWSNIAVRHERLSGAVPLGRSLIADIERTKWLLPDLIHEIGHGVALLGEIGLTQAAFRAFVHFIEAYLLDSDGDWKTDSNEFSALPLLPDNQFAVSLGRRQLRAAANAAVAQSVWTPWLEGLSMYFELLCDPKDDPSEISAVHECLRLLIDFDIPQKGGETNEEYARRMMDQVTHQFEEFYSNALRDTSRINTLRYFDAPCRGESDIYILGFLTVLSVVAAWEATLDRRIMPARAAILLMNATQGSTTEVFPELNLSPEQFSSACQSNMVSWLNELAALPRESIEECLKPVARDCPGSPILWKEMHPKKVTKDEFIETEMKRTETSFIPKLFQLAGIDPASSDANERKSADFLLKLFKDYVIRNKLLPIGNDDARMLLMQDSDYAGICPRTFVGKRKSVEQEDTASMPRYSHRFWPMEGGENEKIRLRRLFARENTARLSTTRVIDLVGFPNAPSQTRMSYTCHFLGESYTRISGWGNSIANEANDYPDFAEVLRKRCMQAETFRDEQNTLGSVRFLAERLQCADALSSDLEELLTLDTKQLATDSSLAAASAAFSRGGQFCFKTIYEESMADPKVRRAIARVIHACGIGTKPTDEPVLAKSALASRFISLDSFSGVRPFNS
ncbi:MAG: hypothetical protein AAF558_03025 [Verrucomicrobiota bacterium]